MLDVTKKKEICAILAVGCTRETAAAYVGCAVSTIARTAQRDAEFAADLQRAEGRYEVSQMRNIFAAGEKNWRASAWALERRFPDQYAQRQPGTLTSSQIAHVLGEFARVIVEEVPDADQRRQVLARVLDMAKQFEREWDYEREVGTKPISVTKRAKRAKRAKR